MDKKMRNQVILFIFALVFPVFVFGQEQTPLMDSSGNVVGYRLLPQTIKAKLIENDTIIIENDTTIINQTDLKIYCLFDTKDIPNRRRIFAGEWLFGGFAVCKTEVLTLMGSEVNFLLTPDGIDVVYYEVKRKCNKKIKSNAYASNFGQKLKIGKFKSRFGKIEVNPRTGCMDTGYNPLKIKTKKAKSILMTSEILFSLNLITIMTEKQNCILSIIIVVMGALKYIK